MIKVLLNKKLKNTELNSSRFKRKYKIDLTEVHKRAETLATYDNIEILLRERPYHFEALTDNRSGQYSIILQNGLRIKIIISEDNIEKDENGNLILAKIEKLKFIGVGDYHKRAGKYENKAWDALKWEGEGEEGEL